MLYFMYIGTVFDSGCHHGARVAESLWGSIVPANPEGENEKSILA
jgi:hypothetical protein